PLRSPPVSALSPYTTLFRSVTSPTSYSDANSPHTGLLLLPRRHVASWSYAVLADVSICYPPVWDRLFTRYSPVRRWNVQCASTPNIPARLACVKHAASVRPEPGSNSYV